MLNISLTHTYIKKQASILRDFLGKKNVKLSTNSILEVLSRSYGYRNWNTLSIKLATEEVSTDAEKESAKNELPDDDAPAEEAMYFAQQAARVAVKPLSFHIYANEADDPKDQEGVFVELNNIPWENLDKQFNALQGEYEGGQSPFGNFIDGAVVLLETSKFHYLDVYAHMGLYLLEMKYYQAAESWYRAGVDIGRSIIEKNNHSGKIIWGSLTNRPFLRCHEGLILSLLKLDRKKEAGQLMEEHLYWNPMDNLGVRSLLGPTYLSLGKVTKARKYLKKGQDFPEAQYMLALLEFRSGNFVEAATTLRKAFLSNEYIAEILLGNPNPNQRLVFYYIDTHEVEWAKKTLTEDMINLWRDTKDAIRFLDWMYHGSLALEDRAAMMRRYETLTRTKIGDPERDLACLPQSEITKKETAEIIKKGFNRYERENWPWEEDAINGDPWRKGEEPDWVKEQMQQS